MEAEDQNGREEQRPKVGAELEQRRREKGLSLKDVEQATKIRARYLEGLEREDYGLLPDAVYVQGFLKTYANFLGLDGERLSREFKDLRAPRRLRQLGGYESPPGTSEFERPLISPGGLGAGRRRISGTTVLAIALAVLVLAVVIGGLYFVGSRSSGGPAGGEAGEPEAQNGAVPAETTSAASSGPATQPAAGGGTTSAPATQPAAGGGTTSAPASAFRATVRVTGSPSGLNILTDGSLAYSQVAQPGFSQTFEAKNTVTVSAANGGAVSVEANGRSSGPLGSPGQPVTRDFTRQ